MSRIAFYAGSFDPVTNGHVDVIAALAGSATARSGHRSSSRQGADLLGRGARRSAARGRGTHRGGAGVAVEVVTFDHLAVAQRGAGATHHDPRPARCDDFDYEMQLSGMNEAMEPELQTVFLPASASVRSYHRDAGSADRSDGRRCFALRAGCGE
jgi:pantetheine-phosphate adenylyltransferase